MPEPRKSSTEGSGSQEQRREVVTTLWASFFVLIPFIQNSFTFKSHVKGAPFDCSGWLNF